MHQLDLGFLRENIWKPRISKFTINPRKRPSNDVEIYADFSILMYMEFLVAA